MDRNTPVWKSWPKPVSGNCHYFNGRYLLINQEIGKRVLYWLSYKTLITEAENDINALNYKNYHNIEKLEHDPYLFINYDLQINDLAECARHPGAWDVA